MREEGEEAHRAWGYCRSLSLLRGCHEPKSTRKFCLQKSMMSSPKRVKVQEAQWQKILALFTITGLRKDPVFSEVTHFIHWLCNSDSQSNGPELGLYVMKWYKNFLLCCLGKQNVGMPNGACSLQVTEEELNKLHRKHKTKSTWAAHMNLCITDHSPFFLKERHFHKMSVFTIHLVSGLFKIAIKRLFITHKLLFLCRLCHHPIVILRQYLPHFYCICYHGCGSGKVPFKEKPRKLYIICISNLLWVLKAYYSWATFGLRSPFFLVP